MISKSTLTRSTALLAVTLLVIAGGAFAQESDEAITDQVDAIFAEWDNPNSAGCALGVIQDGEFVYRRGYGMANIEHSILLSSKSVFYIASTSKQFMAASIIMLAERGRLSLDDDVRKHVPELPDYGNTITIRHMLHHTSGLRDYLELWPLAGEYYEDVHTADEILELIVRQKGLNFEPGDEYSCSNSGYFLLSVIVERVSGQSLREFAHENIFEPLGMGNAHFHTDRNHIVPHRAIGHFQREDGSMAMYMSNFEQVGSGGLYTNVDALLLWDRNFYDDVLSDGTLMEELHRRGVLNDGDTLSHAAGLMIGEHRGLRTVSHAGSFLNYKTELLRFPNQRFSVVCLCNLGHLVPARLARQVADVYLADLLAEEPEQEELPEPEAAAEPLSLDASLLAEYAGQYYSEELGVVYRFRVTGSALYLIGRNLPAGPLEATAEDSFVTGNVDYEFVRDEAGEVSGVTVSNPWARGIEFVRIHDPGE
jgi:CubicO group peptidase (beta-lactamase class C family)